MLVPRTDLGKALMYYAITLGLCLVLTFLAPRLGPRTPDIAMFTPFAAVCLMLLVFTRDGYTRQAWRELGLHRLGMSKWGLALGIPLAVLGFAYGLVWMSSIAEPAIPADHVNLPWFLLDIIASIIIVALAAGLTEEIGWRGYLLPHLKALGVWKAVLLLRIPASQYGQRVAGIDRPPRLQYLLGSFQRVHRLKLTTRCRISRRRKRDTNCRGTRACSGVPRQTIAGVCHE